MRGEKEEEKRERNEQKRERIKGGGCGENVFI